MPLRLLVIMPKDNLSILQRVHRNRSMFKGHIGGQSILEIAQEYGLTYERTRQIIKEQNMRLHFVVDIGDDCVIFEGNLKDCEVILDHYSGNLAIVGFRDLTPEMIKSLNLLRERRKNQNESQP